MKEAIRVKMKKSVKEREKRSEWRNEEIRELVQKIKYGVFLQIWPKDIKKK